MAATLSVQGVRKAFRGRPVLGGLDLDVRAGSLTTIVGPSGCGKTTLLRLIAGFERADAGSIRVDETIVSGPGVHQPPEKRGIGIVTQDGALFPHLDVAANVGFGLPRSERKSSRVDELLSLVGLSGLERRFPHELSGGEQQRVALARALAPVPHVLLLDEPFSSLDPALRASLRAEVRAVLRTADMTAVLVTHDQVEALSIADQVGVMRDGRLVQVGPPATVYRTPVDADVARFMGDAVLLPGEIARGQIRCALGSLPLTERPVANGPATAMIRPEQLVLNAHAVGIDARVVAIAYQGHDAIVSLVTAVGGGLALSARVPAHAIPMRGETVKVSVRGGVVAFAPADAR